MGKRFFYSVYKLQASNNISFYSGINLFQSLNKEMFHNKNCKIIPFQILNNEMFYNKNCEKFGDILYL